MPPITPAPSQSSHNWCQNTPAAEIAAKVKEFFPNALTTYAPTLERQRIVDSWPQDMNDSAARRDWGWKPKHDFDRAFAEYIIPKIKARYGC